MKLRRAIAAAAATAAIAPLALLSAPAALAASGDESASPSVSASVTEQDTAASASASPSDTESAPDTSDSRSESTDDTEDASESENETDTDTDPGTTDSEDDTDEDPAADPNASASTSTSPSPSPSASESQDEEKPDFCADPDDDSIGLSTELRSGLSGLPETVVAGSGWTPFSFDVSNKGDDEIKDIMPLIGVAAVGWNEEDYSGQIRVQVLDKSTGSWKTLADAAGEGATFPAFSLGAGQSTSFQLRLSVSGKVPDAIGLTGGFAQYADDEGCWLADDPNGWIYFFDILAAGSDAGDPNEAEPQGGMGDLDAVAQVAATGSLAETGSSSALPVIGLVGGIAVVAGAGAVFAVRRRKSGTDA
ncbi:LAETG motif-containing sortase-dependent surface protein [Streptomyces flavalbus]|uniref:LAETG motif-containing sortase-dependent surface protein n=1 Tax=Streptomyces flavalbus TaxID=2665155 RepID=A0ABW2WE35_9ACTN